VALNGFWKNLFPEGINNIRRYTTSRRNHGTTLVLRRKVPGRGFADLEKTLPRVFLLAYTCIDLIGPRSLLSAERSRRRKIF
jgi:hypothetical protein